MQTFWHPGAAVGLALTVELTSVETVPAGSVKGARLGGGRYTGSIAITVKGILKLNGESKK